MGQGTQGAGGWQACCPFLLLAIQTHLFLGISPFMESQGGEVATRDTHGRRVGGWWE